MKYITNILKIIRDYGISIVSLMKLFFLSRHQDTHYCLMISNGATLSGAPLVLLEAAKILQAKGYQMIMLCEYCGPFNGECKKNNLISITVPKFKTFVLRIIRKMNLECIWVNTIVYYNWVQSLQTGKTPIIWWIHEGETYIDLVRNDLPEELPESVHVCCVSSWTERAMQENGISYRFVKLPYGCRDLCRRVEFQVKQKSKLRVTVIGNICKRKNQIFFIDCIEQLAKEVLEHLEFIIVGSALSISDPYFVEFQKRIQASRINIEYIDNITRNDMSEFYNSIDAVVCCSIDDPLPVVITEGMMFGKIVITSECTGQFDFIENGINGFKFTFSEKNALQNLLSSLWDKRNDLNIIGINARETYEKLYMPEIFEEKLVKLMDAITEDTIKK